MSTVQRQILWGAFLSLIVFVLSAAAFLAAYPLAAWSELWKRQLMDIPFIVFLPSVSVAIGIIFGFTSGLTRRKQLQAIEGYLRQLEEGRQFEIAGPESNPDLSAITSRIAKVQKQIAEQTKLSQRLATEKAEDQETRIQEIISQERNRLARELHDSVSQQLFAASMLMSAINEAKTDSDNNLETKQLKIVEEMIHQSQLEMRALLLHLRPAALKGKTLQEGIVELLIELSQKVTMEIVWKVEEFPLDKGVEDHLFRVLQESASNTLRHSKATKLEVLLIKRDEFIILRISDDGIGFDIEEQKAGSYGLQNMHERALEIGATLKIVSLKNKGTRLEVKVPIMSEGEIDD
ncbi:sensor histidine kinase [Bacillus canaveralius]|uniref:Sensor histidine kinase n=1 Tax=Bacillus canaveralius TaxID=1403243 RepID=A0A2N5GH14_9BACI|nr:MULTISPECIES: sensor histidine kinase [Bacillus]PLR80033.1 sensor histidine kinase [Bacillus canaveralius]PLR87081.1 sensor histidine kinase [Bacillus sp. V33-4]PLR94937.1 sensor histidine kinase [Bacillus canaveralius]RSK50675.1 sensor histidine kinase [Bacillus canaveralius]